MGTIEKIRGSRAAAERRLAKLNVEKEKIEDELRSVRGEIVELDAALRVIERFEEPTGRQPEAAGGAQSEVTSLSKSEAIKIALSENPGAKVGRIVKWIATKYGMEIGVKTAGNILWMLKTQGLARRHGQDWYPDQKKSPPDGSGGDSST